MKHELAIQTTEVIKELLFNHPSTFIKTMCQESPDKSITLIVMTLMVADHDVKRATSIIVEAHEEQQASIISRAKRDFNELEAKVREELSGKG